MSKSNPINDLFLRISRTLKLRVVAISCCVALLDFAIFAGLFHWCDLHYPAFEQTAATVTIFVAVLEILFFIVLFHFLRNRTTVISIARKAEQLHPEFNGALICAVEKEHVEVDKRTLFEHLLVEDMVEKLEEKELTIKTLCGRITRTMTLTLFVVTALSLWGVVNSRYFEKTVNYLQKSDAITITPELLQTPRKSDFTIMATVLRWEQIAEIEVKSDHKLIRYPMLNSDNKFLFTFYGLTDNVQFRIVTPSLKSEFQTLDVFTPPTAGNILIKLTPPVYCGMKPSKFDNLQDISALEGTEFDFSCNLIPHGTSGTIVFNDDNHVLKRSNNLDKMSLKITENGEYRLILEDKKGRTVESTIFTIEMIPDLAPVVSIITPGKDSNFAPDEILEMKAVASDDFGVTKVSLHYSISGHEFVETTFEASINERINDRTIKASIDPKKLKLQNGNVVKYFFTVEDNRQPETLKARSEIFFATVKEPKEKDKDDDKKKDDKNGNDKEQKKVSIHPLIAELKRTIRLSHDAQIYENKDKAEAITEIAKALADLRIKAVKVLDEIKEEVKNPTEPLIIEFQKAIDEIKYSETSTRANLVSEAIQSQETSLNRLSVIAAQLEKNKKKSKGKCDKGGGEGDKGKGKKGGKKGEKEKSLKDTLNSMKKALQEVRRQADRQGALNKNIRRYAGQKVPASEREQLGQRQNDIRRSVQEVNDKLKALEGLEPVKNRLDKATKAENQAAMNLKMGKSSSALRDGVKSHNSLLAAASGLNEQINTLINNEIKAMAKAAKVLSAKQSEAAGNSKGLGSKPKADAEQAKALQNEIKKYSDNLQSAVREMTSQIDELYPEAAEALRKAMTELKKQRLASNMQKGANALNYRRFDKAEKYQKKAAETLNKMSKNLDRSRDLLPGISEDRLMQALQQMATMKQQARDALKTDNKKGMDQLKNQLSKELGELGRGMKSQQMSQLQTTTELLPQASKGNIKPLAATTYQLMNEATALIKNQLMKLELNSRIELNRKTSKPPEKYRKQIEEYFKLLSE